MNIIELAVTLFFTAGTVIAVLLVRGGHVATSRPVTNTWDRSVPPWGAQAEDHHA